MDNDFHASDVGFCTLPRVGPTLTKRQREVFHNVREIDSQVADMYIGAIHVLTQTSNPNRFAQAAHSLRELMDELSASVLGSPVMGPSLGYKVRQLADAWAKVHQLRSSFEVEATQITGPLRKFLRKSSRFFEWFKESRPSVREKIGQFHGATEPRGRRLPQAVERIHVARWLNMRDDLLAIAHHGRRPTDLEFRRVADGLDSLLIERLRPKAFEQHDEIDRIIEEAEDSR